MHYQDCLIKFGPFILDVHSRTLSCNGWPLRLPPRAVEVLLAMIEKQGQVMSSQELMRAVWGHSAVQPENVTHYVSELRRVLCDDSGEYIRTVNRHGYKFVAAGSIVNAAEAAAGD